MSNSRNRTVRVLCTVPQNKMVQGSYAKILSSVDGKLKSEDKKKKEYCYSFKTIKSANEFIEILKSTKELYRMVNTVILEKNESEAGDTSAILE